MKNENIVSIINLHAVEKQLFEINNKRGNLPKKIDELNNEINICKNSDDENLNRISEIDKRKTIINGDLTDTEKKINSLNEQMYKVKSNKEYDALNQFELISDDAINGTTTHKEAVETIKTKWPKDNSGPVEEEEAEEEEAEEEDEEEEEEEESE